MSGSKYDIGLLTTDSRSRDRVQTLCDEFAYQFCSWDSLEPMIAERPSLSVLIADHSVCVSPEAAGALAQVISLIDDRPLLICALDQSITKEGASFIKKMGIDVILLFDELFKTSKLEFVCTQAIQFKFLPIKIADLSTEIPVSFDVYHFMPLQRKFIKIMTSGAIPEVARVEKLKSAGEFYIRRDEAIEFRRYCMVNVAPQDLNRQCRAQFLELTAQFTAFAFLVTDQSEYDAFQNVEMLFKKCVDLCRDLFTCLKTCLKTRTEPWEIVHHSGRSTFGLLDRSPALSIYVALLAIQLGYEKIDELMVSALICDLGLIFLSPGITRRLRLGEVDALSSSEISEFHRYPLKSVEIALSRRLELSELQHETILGVNERVDGFGFPQKVLGDKIIDTAQLIQFVKKLDARSQVQFDGPSVSIQAALLELYKDESRDPKCFTYAFLNKMKTYLTTG